MTLEIFPPAPASTIVPELIVVLDAKYSSLSQWEKMRNVTTKYSKIGDIKTGRVLSRQVWALTPASPAGTNDTDTLRGYCTVDNEAFWSDQFDIGHPVDGAIQTRPVGSGRLEPLQTLIVSLLKLSGIDYREN
jgi:hypothetical protein